MTARESQVYGLHAVSSILSHDPCRIHSLDYDGKSRNPRLLTIVDEARKHGIQCQAHDRRVLDNLVQGRHQGVVACMPLVELQDESALAELLQSGEVAPLFLILDNVTDPHNLGACLRSADAAGVTAVIIPKDKSCPINATVRKVASGATDSVAILRVSNLVRCLERLQKAGVWIVGAADEAKQSAWDIDYRLATAIVLGAEGRGMRRLTRKFCDHTVSLPMDGLVSSLNVSVVAGILLFEARRQRQVPV